ncbi:hypothetical protein BDZ91DRAFT_716482 [Kalaharituber pfeilii]|nr:hypothetical protein BDZ91DRAFT_716482 [Kalaharituber pfeilii]
MCLNSSCSSISRNLISLFLLLILSSTIFPSATPAKVNAMAASPRRPPQNAHRDKKTDGPGPSFNFPGSVTVCQRDYYENCTTLVEAPGSVSRRCTRAPIEYNDRISSLEVKNGCCQFFKVFECRGATVLVACNEKKGTLFGTKNNQISSWKCYFGER